MVVFSPEADELRELLVSGNMVSAVPSAPDAFVNLYRAPRTAFGQPEALVSVGTCTDSDYLAAEAQNPPLGGADLIEAMSTSIWFRNRDEWRFAWRWMRLIAKGHLINAADLFGTPNDMLRLVSLSPYHAVKEAA